MRKWGRKRSGSQARASALTAASALIGHTCKRPCVEHSMDMGKEDVGDVPALHFMLCAFSLFHWGTNRTKSLTFFHSVLNGFALSAKMDFFISLAEDTDTRNWRECSVFETRRGGARVGSKRRPSRKRRQTPRAWTTTIAAAPWVTNHKIRCAIPAGLALRVIDLQRPRESPPRASSVAAAAAAVRTSRAGTGGS